MGFQSEESQYLAGQVSLGFRHQYQNLHSPPIPLEQFCRNSITNSFHPGCRSHCVARGAMVPQFFSQLHHIYKCTDGFNSTTPFSQTHLCLKSMESELAFVSVRTDALSQIPENFEDILSLRKAFSSTESWAWICPCKKEEDVVAYLAQKLLLLVTSEIVLETTIQDCMKVCHW